VKDHLTPQASIATRTTLRDDRETSLTAARAESIYTANQNFCKAKFFRWRGLTRFRKIEVICPSWSFRFVVFGFGLLPLQLIDDRARNLGRLIVERGAACKA
jgi:hypothetical protein